MAANFWLYRVSSSISLMTCFLKKVLLLGSKHVCQLSTDCVYSISPPAVTSRNRAGSQCCCSPQLLVCVLHYLYPDNHVFSVGKHEVIYILHAIFGFSIPISRSQLQSCYQLVLLQLRACQPECMAGISFYTYHHNQIYFK